LIQPELSSTLDELSAAASSTVESGATDDEFDLKATRLPLSGDTSSSAANTLINTWVKDCTSTHDCCRRATADLLPKRVLEV
jgi:hypothetical protein